MPTSSAPARPATDSIINGTTGTDSFVINMTTPGSFDLSTLTFINWNFGLDTVTVNGSSGADHDHL